MSFQLYTYIALKEDLPEYGLKKGQIGMVIEHYEMPEDEEDGYSLEGFGIDIPGITVEVSESQIYSITDYLADFNHTDKSEQLHKDYASLSGF